MRRAAALQPPSSSSVRKKSRRASASATGSPAADDRREAHARASRSVLVRRGSPSASTSARAMLARSSPPPRRSRGRSPLPSRPARGRAGGADRRAHRRCCPPRRPAPTVSIQRRSASRSCDHRIERLADLHVGGALGEVAHRRARAATPAPPPRAFITSRARVGDQRRGGGVVEHGELAGHVRLERELVQQPLAEGVDRLDLQPARRLQRRGEEPARLRAARRRRRARALQLGDRARRAPRPAASSIRRASRRRGAPSRRRRPW